MINLSVLIPAYQEAENLDIIIPKLINSLDVLDIQYQILIIDSNISNDDTKSICNKYAVDYYLRESGNSYGDAIRTGIKEAIGKHLLIMDADGSHEPNFIKRLWEYRNNYDVIIASRYVDGGSTEDSKLLTLMSRILNITYGLVLGINCKDISNSFKLYKLKDLKLLTFFCNEFDIVEEILFKLNNSKRITIKEVPYTFKKRIAGVSKRNLVLFIFKYVFTLAKLRFMK